MSIHNRLSSSAASQWIRCPGSIAFIEFLRKEKKIPQDSSNDSAKLGTALHTVLEYCIKKIVSPLKLTPAKIKKIISLPVSDYDLGGVHLYWKFIDDSRDSFDKTIAEKKYDLSNRFNIDIGGTADVTQMSKHGILHIGDYKNGRGLVEVRDNYQLLMYALGAYVEYNERYHFKYIVMSIGQPNGRPQHPNGRVRSYQIMVSELLKWEKNYLKPATEKIKNNSTELIPGDIQCEWCPAKHKCEANGKQLVQLAHLDFAKYAEPRQDFPEIRELTKQQVAFILDNKSRLINFLKDVEAYAVEAVGEGEQVGDYYLQSTLSNRKFKEGTEFTKVLKKYKISAKSLRVNQPDKQMTLTDVQSHLKTKLHWDKLKIQEFMKEITSRHVTGKSLIKGESPEQEFENLEEVKTPRKPRAKRTLRFRKDKNVSTK